jgi:hypothetical protein
MAESHSHELSLIDEFMAEYDIQDVTCAVVDVGPERIYRSLRGHDLAADPLAMLFVGLRPRHLTLKDIVAPGTGFVLLGERPGCEFTIGSVGRLGRTRIDFAAIAPTDFAGFAQRGCMKLAWSVRVMPYGHAQALVLIDVRAKAYDRNALARLSRSWSLAGPLSRLIRRRAIARAALHAQSLFPASGTIP